MTDFYDSAGLVSGGYLAGEGGGTNNYSISVDSASFSINLSSINLKYGHKVSVDTIYLTSSPTSINLTYSGVHLLNRFDTQKFDNSTFDAPIRYVSNSVIIKWDESAYVEGSVLVKWNERVFIDNSCKFLWDSRSFIDNSCKLLWDSRSFIYN
jgi:hypothetical protein